MNEERYKLIKENVYTRCYIAEHSGIGLTFPDKEEIELIDYVEELKDQLHQKENITKEIREYLKLREDDNSMCSVCGVMSDRILEILDRVSDKE